MITHATPGGSDEVLYVKHAPMARTRREGLRAVGVEVTHLTPEDARRLFGDETTPRDTARLADAKLCVLGEGTGVPLATAILLLRNAEGRRTVVMTESLAEVGRGMALGRARDEGGTERCHFVSRESDLIDILRGLGAPTRSVATPSPGLATRPARPLPFVADPEGYTHREQLEADHETRWRARMATGRIAMTELLDEVPPPRFREMAPMDVLIFLIRHLPTEQLARMGEGGTRAWWGRYADTLQGRPPQGWRTLGDLGADRAETALILWHAMARDGGRETLAGLPDTMHALRDEVRASWDITVAEAVGRTEAELLNPGARTSEESVGSRILREWGVVPCEDPLAPDADPHHFRPSLATFQAAHRYRSAPEVILLARERWGSRPYQERFAAGQLAEFVANSPPTSAREQEAWFRLLQTLPRAGRMYRCVLDGIGQDWPRAEIAIANACHEADDLEWFAPIVPCFDVAGELDTERQRRLGNEILGIMVGFFARQRRR